MGFIDLFITVVNMAAQEKIVRAQQDVARLPPKPWGYPPIVAAAWGQTEYFPTAWRQVAGLERDDDGHRRVVNTREYQWNDPITQGRQGLGWGNMVAVERFDTRLGRPGCPCQDPNCPGR